MAPVPPPAPSPGEGGGKGKGTPREKRARVKVWVARGGAKATSSLLLEGRVASSDESQARRVTIQRWAGHGRWMTVGRERVARNGYFRKAVRLRARARLRVAHLRVVARTSAPSRPIRVRLAK